MMGFCKDCKRWVPDAFIVCVGTCDLKERPTLDCEGDCEFFCVKTGEEFMWCEDCRTTVHETEIERHKCHCLYAKVRSDPDASDYLTTGD